MLKIQKLLLNIVALLLLGAALALIVQNWHITEQNARFLTGTLVDLPLGLLLGVVGLMVGGAILLKTWEQTFQLGSQYKKANRELERREVSREEAASRVKVLESKVETLEKALNAALKSNQPQ